MEQQFGVCRVSIAPLRSEPRDQAEIVSQLLFGDFVEITEKTEKWWRVKNAFDDYEGWMDFKQLELLSAESYVRYGNSNYLAPAALNNSLIAEDGSQFYLGASSSLPDFRDGYCHLGDKRFKVDFEPLQVNYKEPAGALSNLALFFQNAPYLWGGRTLFGIDCSGFVQSVFKMAGVKLKRDASQQAEEGTLVDFLPEARMGDVAFFDNPEGRITHVGILLNHHEIIHASGKVRIDPIDDQGIFNKELNKYTHQLRIIKRFI